MATQMGSRMVFENAKTLVRGLGYSVDHAKLTQSYLRSEVALSTSIANYHIPVLVNDTQNGASRVNEKRLNLQDIFVTTEIAVLIGVGTGTNTAAKLYTYPNATAFTSSSDDDLWSIYNGFLNLTINNEQILPAWDVARHYFVPQTQQNTNFNAATATSPAQYTIDQWAASSDAFYPVEPGIVMNGAANINFQLTANGAPASITTNSFICVLQRGILCQNVTTVK
jgi:hypothetical protein